MTKKRIVYVRSNPVSPDSRVEREVGTLSNAEYDVTVLAWGRSGMRNGLTEQRNGYEIVRIPLPAPLGIKVIPFIPVWWICEFIWLLTHKWDVVHAADFDTCPPALFVTKLKRKKLVYDIFDTYAERLKNRHLRYIINKIDVHLMRLADAIIIVDSCRLCFVPDDALDKITLIYNCPVDISKNEIKINADNGATLFNIFYGGIFTPYRDIHTMIDVVTSIPDSELIVAGGGQQNLVDEFCNYISGNRRVSYIGMQPYSSILQHSYVADLLFALYDPIIPNNRLSSPNKLFEAMMCGKPIIVNEGVATADKVREENCGLVVPYGDYEALKEAVLLLKNNPELRKELGENGRRAYEAKYNWKIMEERLLDLYTSLEKEQ